MEKLAFPLHPEHYDKNESGMTLRDYFAAKAMQAMISRTPWDENGFSYSLVSESAYDIAEKMMKAREQ